jgi:hypothetical protein
MPVASVKGKVMVTEVSHAIGKSSGRTGETKKREAAGKPDSLLGQMKVESLQWKTVKSYDGNATAKQCRANNSIFLF